MDRPFYSGKHKKHGTNLQVIADPDGDLLWVSGAALLGARQDDRVDRGVLDELEAAGLGAQASSPRPSTFCRSARNNQPEVWAYDCEP